MKYTNLISLALMAKAAAVVTQVLDVVEIIHQDAVVLIDEDGTPWSTSSVVSTAYQTASTLRGLSTSSSSALSHSHSSSIVEISIASSTPSSSTPTSNPPTTFVTKTTTITLGSATANKAVDNSIVSITASASTSDAAASSAVVAEATTSTPVVISEVTTSTPAVIAEVTTTSTPAVVAEATTSTPVVITPTSSTTPAVDTTPASSTKETSASSSAPVSTATAAFTGEGTYYDVGLGACGWTNLDSDLVVALNAAQFGTQSNGNPVCGNKILVNGPIGSVTVTVVDKCPGCSYGSLDLSPSAFAKIADMSAGRVDISWSFT